MERPSGPPVRGPGGWRTRVREIPDFPAPGVLFRDILPVLADPTAYRQLLDELATAAAPFEAALIMAPEARGFLLAAPLAQRLGAGLILARKGGKLPPPVYGEDYALEYGIARLEVEPEASAVGRRVLVVDDVLATGGTVAAVARLVERLGAQVAGYLFVMELAALSGRLQLGGRPTAALWTV
ncbi:MAG: adenine phosphoribosyltransferase [Thermaerobacter sp.]|nr:adenine phosphoribosyltransferase [Thermaerobacter sp.]